MIDQPMGETRDGWTRVSKEGLDTFLKTYPNPLVHDCCAISDPPLHSWNDFTGGRRWPESMVAKAQLFETDKMDEMYGTSYGDRFIIRSSTPVSTPVVVNKDDWVALTGALLWKELSRNGTRITAILNEQLRGISLHREEKE